MIEAGTKPPIIGGSNFEPGTIARKSDASNLNRAHRKVLAGDWSEKTKQETMTQDKYIDCHLDSVLQNNLHVEDIRNTAPWIGLFNVSIDVGSRDFDLRKKRK